MPSHDFLLSQALPGATSAETLSVKITSIRQWDLDVDLAVEGSWGDYWTRVTLQGETFDNLETGLLENGFGFGEGRWAPVTFDLTSEQRQPTWTFETEVDASEPITVEVETGVTLMAANHGPQGPADATVDWAASVEPGLDLIPPPQLGVSGLPVGGSRPVEATLQLACSVPGPHEFGLSAMIAGSGPTYVDSLRDNDRAESNGVVDCWNGIPMRVVTPSWPLTVVVPWTPVKVALVTITPAAVGEARAFDATSVEVASLRFGSRAEVLRGGGASAITARGKHTLAPDGSFDRARDLVGLFVPRPSDLEPGVGEVCVAGRYRMATGETASFLGCDDAVVFSPR